MGPRKRHTPEQVVRKLTQADRLLAEGKEVADVYRELQVAEPTLYRWRNQFGGLKADDVKRLKDLERENAAPKRLLAEAELEKAALKEIARETSKPGPKVGSRSSPHGGDEGQRTVRLPGHRATPHHPTPPPAQPHPGRPRRRVTGMAAAMGERTSSLGFRRAYHAARSEGWMVNHKRLQRLWRDEGLGVPQHRRRKRIGTSTTSDTPVADAPNRAARRG